jgi:CheY-like chemotaxis protein
MKKRILVIDDDPLVRRTLQLLLNQAGYTVDAAANGMQGLEKLPQGHFDLVMTDVRMPGMDGFSVLRAIREYCEAEHRPPFAEVVLTGFNDVHALESAESLGIKHFILKPFDTDELLDEVQRLLAS